MKKENINKIFESIASKYDLMNDLMSFGLHRNWKKKFWLKKDFFVQNFFKF